MLNNHLEKEPLKPFFIENSVDIYGHKIYFGFVTKRLLRDLSHEHLIIFLCIIHLMMDLYQ